MLWCCPRSAFYRKKKKKYMCSFKNLLANIQVWTGKPCNLYFFPLRCSIILFHLQWFTRILRIIKKVSFISIFYRMPYAQGSSLFNYSIPLYVLPSIGNCSIKVGIYPFLLLPFPTCLTGASPMINFKFSLYSGRGIFYLDL